MKIAWIGDSPEIPTGFAMVTRMVCSHLARRGHSVSILGWQTSGQPTQWEGCSVFPLRYGQAQIPQYLMDLRPSWVVTLGSPSNLDLMASPQMHSWLQYVGARWLLYYVSEGELPNGRLPDSWVATIAAADVAVASSRYVEAVSVQCGLQPRYIPHGVDTNLFCPPVDRDAAKRLLNYAGKFVILSDARNQPRKMLPRLLLIFARFAADKKDVVLHLHCDPHDPAARTGGYDLRSMIASLGIGEQVCFTHGFSIRRGVTLSRLAALYQAADVHLLTSGGEGFGLPTLQACASGVVPMAPDYSANRELLEEHGEPVRVSGFEEAGFGIQWALIDIEDCVARLNGLYYDRDLLERKSGMCRRFALEYDWSRVVDLWADLLGDESGHRGAPGFEAELCISDGRLRLLKDRQPTAFDPKALASFGATARVFVAPVERIGVSTPTSSEQSQSASLPPVAVASSKATPNRWAELARYAPMRVFGLVTGLTKAVRQTGATKPDPR